jgi:excisionase family DNA binding protein
MTDQNLLLKPSEASKILKCSESFVYKLASQGRIPSVRLPMVTSGKPKFMIRFKFEDIIAFIDQYYSHCEGS